MNYEIVFSLGEIESDFDASGEQLLIVKIGGADVVLSLLTPEVNPVAIHLRTFKANGQQRWRAPKGTRLRLTTTVRGAIAWVGKIYIDSAGDLL